MFSLLPAQNATGNYVKVVQPSATVRLPADWTRGKIQDRHWLRPGMSVVPDVYVKERSSKRERSGA